MVVEAFEVRPSLAGLLGQMGRGSGCFVLGDFSAVGCGSVSYFGPAPVEYLSVAVLIEDRGALHSTAGLYFTIGNTTDREIIGLEIDFSLFDGDGVPVPAFGVNTFRAAVHHRISAGDAASLCTTLDDHVPPGTVALSVSRFRVTVATFADGSVWRNPGGSVFQEEME